MLLAEATLRSQIAAPPQNAIPAGLEPQTVTQQLAPIGQACRTAGTGSAWEAESDGRIELADHPLDKFKVGRDYGKPRGNWARTGEAP